MSRNGKYDHWEVFAARAGEEVGGALGWFAARHPLLTWLGMGLWIGTLGSVVKLGVTWEWGRS
jgi:hypothetical protein